MYGLDYNDGFAEKTLTAEDCCHACLRDRGCHAWAWTVDGACFKKYAIPPKDMWLPRIGDISGTKQSHPSLAKSIPTHRVWRWADWSVSCGERIDGIEYNLGNPDEKSEDNATSADVCCQRCRNLQSSRRRRHFSNGNAVWTDCLTWSFVDGYLCRLLYSYGTYETQNPASVSAYIVTGMHAAVWEGSV